MISNSASKIKRSTLELFQFDKDTRQQGCLFLAGVDEAGRGPLAGPVVAASVIFKPETFIEGINDSKQLSTSKREKLYYKIRQEALAYTVGIVSPAEIDRINILQATFLAMRKAVDKLKIKPDLILIDGRDKPLKEYNQQNLIKGDTISFSIAAASIIAKVTRDKIMNFYDKYYPEYGFISNKGYASQKHIAVIEKIGRSPIHRQSFLLPFEKKSNQLFFDLKDY